MITTPSDYDPKVANAAFTAYWQGYDRGFSEGRATQNRDANADCEKRGAQTATYNPDPLDVAEEG